MSFRLRRNMKETILNILSGHLCPSCSFAYGFADLEGLQENKSGKYTWLPVAKKLDDRIVDVIIHGTTLEYYYHYRRINEELSQLSSSIVRELNRVHQCLPPAPSDPVNLIKNPENV